MSGETGRSRGLYIGFTGLDGAGKSTQAAVLAQRLRALGRQCYVCEPKDDLVAQASIAIARRHGLSQTEYFGSFAFELSKAFGAVRHHFALVAPLLQAGVDVIDPRTNNCRIALAASRGCHSVEKLKEIYDLVPAHDILLHLLVTAEVAHRRVTLRNTDTEDLGDLRKLYKELLEVTPASATSIDGHADQASVALSIWNAIKPKLE